MLRPLATGLAALLCLSSVSFAVQARTAPPSQAPATTTQQQLDAWLDAQPLFSGSVAIARDGVVLARRDVGWADREAARPITSDTVFSIASVGKMVTAIAILQLEAEGRLNLDSPVSDWLPEFRETLDAGVTIDHLLTHTSGLPRLSGFDDATLDRLASNADMVDLLTPDQLRSSGPDGFAYRNINFILLGEIIARASGTSYERFIAEHVSLAAQMGGPHFIRDDRPGDHQIARAYLPVDYQTWWDSEDAVEGANPDDYHFTTPQVTPLAGGGSYASTDDMLALATALRQGNLVALPALAAACGLAETEMGARGYGRGCSWRNDSYGHRLGHTGSTAGVQARFFVYWEAGIDVVVLSNHEGQAAPVFSVIDEAIADGTLITDLR